MDAKVRLFLATREDAFRRGDRSVFGGMTAELSRLGYVERYPLPEAGDFPPLEPGALAAVREPSDPPPWAETTDAPMETTSVEQPERVVPARPARRPPARRTDG